MSEPASAFERNRKGRLGGCIGSQPHGLSESMSLDITQISLIPLTFRIRRSDTSDQDSDQSASVASDLGRPWPQSELELEKLALQKLPIG